MANTNFNTSNETLRKLLGNGLTYRIPSFQRDYSWTADEWEDLWEDILELQEEGEEPAHYMGYLVLQSSNSKEHDVIDGQQRLTTLSIIILAAIQNLHDFAQTKQEKINTDNNQRAEQLRNSYIGYLDPVTLVPRSKLSLNRHNDTFYQTYMVPLEKMPQRGLHASEHLLRKAFDWHKKAIKEYANPHGDDAGVAIATLINNIVDHLFFTVITVTDELNAFKVFETLNARGVRLSSTDLLKNYLFSVVADANTHEQEIKSMENLWEKIVGTLGAESLPEFLRTYWNSCHKLVRKSELFKTIRHTIKTKEDAFSLIRELDRSAHIYVALRNPSDELWGREERSPLTQLQMFSVRQQLSMLMAAYKTFFDSDRVTFQKVLNAVSILSFRYNVICKLHTNELERVYNQIALKIATGEYIEIKQIIEHLRDLYPNDSIFKTSFKEKELVTSNSRNKKIVRYILFQIEKNMGNHELDFESSQITIEHIFPENPTESWSEDLERYTYRLGNMVLLEGKTNRSLGNGDYAVKKEALETSSFKTAQYVAAHYDEWTPDKVSSFQTDLARRATSIWRFNP